MDVIFGVDRQVFRLPYSRGGCYQNIHAIRARKRDSFLTLHPTKALKHYRITATVCKNPAYMRRIPHKYTVNHKKWTNRPNVSYG